MTVLTLLTDFGLTDYYVAAVKGTVLRLAADAHPTLVDISHGVEPGGVAEAAYLLAAAAPTFPTGTVHLAVVDPGVGSARRILAAAAGSAWFVAPDNGLLTGILDGPLGEPPAPDAPSPRVHAVERRELFLDAPGQTFHGRDRFAPVAAALLRGEPLEELGPAIDDPVRLAGGAPPQQDGRTLRGRVLHIDRFGNVITDIPTRWLPAGPVMVSLGSHSTGHRADFYGQIPAGEAAVLPGSLGTLELAAEGESLAERWLIERGREVVLELAPVAGAAAGTRGTMEARREKAVPAPDASKPAP
jgi:hypothetical protein